MIYLINEIFDSLQGEGANLGKEVTFIRLTGCNLACPWCDTEFEKYNKMNVEQIINKVNCKNVVITGGEPLLQNLTPLLLALKKAKKWVAIETNGTFNISEYRSLLDYVAFSPKANTKIHPSFIENADEIRIVNDGLTVGEAMKYEGWRIKNRYISVLEVNGNFNLAETIELLGKINENGGHVWRLGQQYHKLINIR